MGDRVILHSDINCCYASIEHQHHPELAGKPLAVGGEPEARHRIVLTADYEAKKYGVKTGRALWQAKQACPDITFVSPRMDLYLRFSRMAHEIYAEYTDRQEPWALWGKDKKTSKKTCLEVAQTENILSEIKSALYILSHEDDEECKKCCEIRTLSWKRNPRYIDKYRDISLEYKDMEIVVLNDSLNIRDRNLRRKMEKAYAEINKAKYWYS